MTEQKLMPGRKQIIFCAFCISPPFRIYIFPFLMFLSGSIQKRHIPYRFVPPLAVSKNYLSYLQFPLFTLFPFFPNPFVFFISLLVIWVTSESVTNSSTDPYSS